MLLQQLRNGTIRGFGTYKIKDEYIINEAIKNGYNLIDTAELYGNEEIVVKVIKKNVDREIYVSTKISYISIENQKIEESFRKRLQIFEGIKINLLLLHKPSDDCRRDWETLLKLYMENRDKVDYIGVSNYDVKHLEQLEDLEMPVVNQFELNPYNVRTKLIEYCRFRNIIIISHTTLTRQLKFDCPILVGFARKYGTNVAKILLKWAVQNGYVTIPRTSRIDHLKENIQEEGFEISNEDMRILNNDLNQGLFLTKVMW